jgi:hypothetical protein
MKKLFWLTSLLVVCCASRAQQAAEPQDPGDTLLVIEEGRTPMVLRFSAIVKDLNKVWLQWDTDSAVEGDYFIVERTADGNHYETVSAMRRTGNVSHFEWTDLAPPTGSDLYRIKYIGQDHRTLYSKAERVSLSGEVDFKFYPNPVDKLLIIRTAHMVDIQILDATGAIRLSKRLQSGIQVVNISSLERGVYVLRVADKECNRVVSNQLLKN